MFRYSLAAYGWIGLNYVGKGKGMLAGKYLLFIIYNKFL